MFLKAIFFTLISIIFISCGRPEVSTTRRQIKLDLQQIDYLLDNQHFSCDSLDGSHCPPGIARIFIYNKYEHNKSAVCTGFMVSKDTLVTNSHCVRTRADCKFTFASIYNGSSHQAVRCKSVIAIGLDYKKPSDPRKKLDYSVIKISDDYRGQYFNFKSKAPAAGSSLSAWVIDHTGLDKPNPNPFESRITQLQCSVSAQSRLSSLYLRDCPIISGNSGSPIVDGDNDVVAIIWGSNIHSVKSSMPLVLRRDEQIYGLATDIRYFYKYLL